MELKKLPFDKGEFTANGKRYIVKNTLTIARHAEFEKLQSHYGFGLTFDGIVERINQALDLANKFKSIEAWSVIINMKEGIAYNLQSRAHPALLLCSLFIVTEDEDLTEWNEKEQRLKVEDWNKEGYDVNDFFVLASNLVRNFIPVYGEIFQSISGQKKTK
jgi:hypothetical protein